MTEETKVVVRCFSPDGEEELTTEGTTMVGVIGSDRDASNTRVIVYGRTTPKALIMMWSRFEQGMIAVLREKGLPMEDSIGMKNQMMRMMVLMEGEVGNN